MGVRMSGCNALTVEHHFSSGSPQTVVRCQRIITEVERLGPHHLQVSDDPFGNPGVLVVCVSTESLPAECKPVRFLDETGCADGQRPRQNLFVSTQGFGPNE